MDLGSIIGFLMGPDGPQALGGSAIGLQQIQITNTAKAAKAGMEPSQYLPEPWSSAD